MGRIAVKEIPKWVCEICSHNKPLTKNGYNRHRWEKHGIRAAVAEKLPLDVKLERRKKAVETYRNKVKEREAGKKNIYMRYIPNKF